MPKARLAFLLLVNNYGTPATDKKALYSRLPLHLPLVSHHDILPNVPVLEELKGSMGTLVRNYNLFLY